MTRSSLKKRFLGATKWTLIGHVSSQAVRFASSLVLTRLLAPDLYGVMAVGYLVITGLSMISDVGLAGGAIRSKRGDDPVFLDVTWIIAIARGALIMLAALALSGALALGAGQAWLPADSVYRDPRIPTLIAVVSLYSLIAGFESTRSIWARRHLELERLVKIDVVCQVVSSACILVWAWFSPTLWALAFGWLVSAVLKTVLSHLALPGPANRFRWNREAYREVLDFGKWVFLSSTLTYLLVTGDRLLLGAYVNAEAMGFYAIAVLLVGALRTAVQKITAHAALPALSEVARERPEVFKATLYRIRRPLDLVCLLSAGALVYLGQPLVRLLYDPRYAPAGWMLGWLGLSLVAARLDVFEHGLVAMGRVKLLSSLNAARLVGLLVLVPLGYHLDETRGAIIGIAASFILNAVVILALQARLGLFEWRRELMAVPEFAAGVGAGWLLSRALP
ncbi:MAG: oligosaccharide flippase family protein [Caldimonas sp.]